jgi:hypothetical protein
MTLTQYMLCHGVVMCAARLVKLDEQLFQARYRYVAIACSRS